MTSPNDLTTLAVVQDWLSANGTSPGNTDTVLSRLITTCSASILSYLQRASLLSQTYTDTFSGNGGRKYFLNQWPVTSVQSVTVDGRAVLQSPDGIEPGWVLDTWNGYPPGSEQAVTLIGGYCFNRGRANVSITYTAGYLVSNEAAVVPATPYQVTVAQPLGNWTQDAGVTYANGTPLVEVASAPTVGQYSVAAGGVYTFAAADITSAVLISYSYVPASVDDACMNLVSERYRYRARIGMRSQSIGGQTTTSYDISDVPAYIKMQLQNFRSVLPLGPG